MGCGLFSSSSHIKSPVRRFKRLGNRLDLILFIITKEALFGVTEVMNPGNEKWVMLMKKLTFFRACLFKSGGRV